MDNQPLNLLVTTNNNNNPEKNQTKSLQMTDDEQRQVALASIFSSLSSLAASSQHKNSESSISELNFSNQNQTQSPSLALTNSLQSVMAVAMMQQQQQQQQERHQLSAINQIHQPAPPPPVNFTINNESPIFNRVMDTEGQLSSNQPQQRINYCTICNKELCNKYFMKTHMFKMHGINLEMEQTEEDELEEQDNNEEHTEEKLVEDGRGAKGEERDEHNQSECSSTNQSVSSWSTSSNKKTIDKKTNRESTPSTGQTAKKKLSTNANTNTNKQTTSVMNGFAGNSMGGVICDICNKELCSKYFLKVHKQNTHGIADYQDTNQYSMYPFASAIGGSNPFLAAAAPSISANLNPTMPFGPSSNPMDLFNSQKFEDCANSKKSNSAKRARLNLNANQQTIGQTTSVNIDKPNDGFSNLPTDANRQQLESVYRLILAQQQQSHQAAMPANTTASLMTPMDPIAAAAATNPLSALMCFGAMGPPGLFGPAGMSPAMIVDNILRNQHLFNRNNNNVNSNQQTKTIDRNNRNHKQGSSGTSNVSGGKGAKDSSNNGRYYSHYTEACPMCDRRFKSIKWLKTHMMNDHKQEIGAYMQMMMQYLYSNKSQQMAAAASMAVFEQQQQQNLLFQLNSHNMQQQKQQQDSPQQHHLANVLHKNSSQVFPQGQLANNNVMCNQVHNRVQEQSSSIESSALQGHMIPHHSDSFLIDARFKRESLSPEEPCFNKLSPSPSRINMNPYTNEMVCGLKFELEKLNNRQEDDFLLSQSNLHENDDEGSDQMEDSSHSSDIQQQERSETKRKSNNGVEDHPTKQQKLHIETSSN